MVIETTSATAVFEEATAIVEAEWMRLEQEIARWESEVSDVYADSLVLEPHPKRVGTATDLRHGQHGPADRRRHWRGRQHVSPIWPTQRSPPLGRDMTSG
jgi:hypothetical protein